MVKEHAFVALVTPCLLVACAGRGAAPDSTATLTAANTTAAITTIESGPTTDPLPPPVTYRATSDGPRPADPAFEALPGARALHGYLGGAAFMIEIPDEWNGRLVLWMHGFEDFAEQGRATSPDLRRYLIRNGYAWAGSSYSSTGFVPDRGADETVALWDYFARTVGSPVRTYGVGLSMGGWSAQLVAERYADRFDGVLAMCGASGTTRGLGTPAAQLLAGAYAAGITQVDIDTEVDFTRLISERIRPALADRAARDVYEALLVELTGGPRPHAISGLRTTEEVNWRRAALLATARVIPPPPGPYEFRHGAPVDAEDFNAKVLAFPFDEASFESVFGAMATTGELQVPMLTMHTSGDGQTPIIEALLQRTQVDRAGAIGLLVQRVYRDASHCGFTLAEQEASFDDLVDWVENGVRPDGTDFSTGDLSRVDASFEQPPRSNVRQSVLTIEGLATLDGEPFDASWVGAIVLDGGLVTPCNDGLPAVIAGEFELGVLRDGLIAGCAAPGRSVVIWTYVGDTRYFAIDPIEVGMDLTTVRDVVVEFRHAQPQGAAPQVTEFYGEVVTTSGQRVGPGRMITAQVGSVTCGTTSTRSDSTYIIAVVDTSTRPGCDNGGRIDFFLDGAKTETTTTNGVSQRDELTIVVEA